MALPRLDGFSDDGLSYAVANDIGKMYGQAAAEYDARLRSPRPQPWLDNPAQLDEELFHPIRQRLSLEGVFPPASRYPSPTANQPRLFELGNNVVAVDPATGQSKVVYQSAPPPIRERTVGIPTQPDLLGKPGAKLTATPTELKDAFDAGTLPPDVATNALTKFYIDQARLKAPSAGTNFMNAVEAGKSAVKYPTATNQKTGQRVIFKDGKWQSP